MGDNERKPDDAEILGRIDDTSVMLGALEGGLEQYDRLATVGTLSAFILHELKNLLTPAIAYAELARSRPGDEPLQKKALDKIVLTAGNAINVAESLLGFINPTDLDTGPANIAGTLRNAMECLTRDPAKDNIRVSYSIDADQYVMMPSLALQQVFLNILLNACNALRGRGGRLSFRSAVEPDGTTALITIADDGPGIPAEILEHLFTPFVTSPASAAPAAMTAGPTNATPRHGNGLGLAICRHLLERYDGSIEAASSPAHGTTFSIRVPISPSARAKAG